MDEAHHPHPVQAKEWESWNYWSNTPKFAVSLLEAMYGDAATKENDWAFDYLPKVDREYSWTHIWDDMYRGKLKGLLAFGMNGVAIGPNSQKNIDALKKAEWLVVCEIYPDETSGFWQSPGITTGRHEEHQDRGVPSARRGIRGEGRNLRQFGALAAMEMGGGAASRRCQTRSGDPGADFPEGARAVQEGRRQVPGPDRESRLDLTSIPTNPSLAEVAKELNGRAIADVTDPATKQVAVKAGQQLPGFAFLRDDGSTSSGNWLFCGSWTEAGPLMQRRGTDDPSGLGIYPNWGWSWPMNRRVLYNRASCDVNGKPWDPDRRQVWWNEAHEALGRQRRAGFQGGLRAQGSHGSVHHESGRRRANVRAAGRNGRRPVPRALRADREPGRESAASAAVQQSRGEEVHDQHGQVRDHRARIQRSSAPPIGSPNTIITGPKTIQ